jgi:hypothetical protein
MDGQWHGTHCARDIAALCCPSMTTRPTAIEEAERAGFDMSLIDESLRLSHEQRALQHQEALNLALELESAGRKLRERPEPPDSAAVRR